MDAEHLYGEEPAYIIDAIPSGIGIFDVRGASISLLYLNDGYYRMLHTERAKRAEFFGARVAQAIHPSDVPGILTEAHASISEDRLFHHDFRVLDGAGGYRWVSVSASHRPTDAQTERFYASYHDIDEMVRVHDDVEEARKRAERQLEDERIKMKSMQGDILSASCFSITYDHNIDLNNDKVLNYAPVGDSDVVHEAILIDPRISQQNAQTRDVLLSAAEQIPDPEQRREFISMCSHFGMVDAYARGERERKLEYRRMTGKGLIWVSTRIVMLPDPRTGDILAFFYTTDIDEQKVEKLIDQRIVSDGCELIATIRMPSLLLRFLSVGDKAGHAAALGTIDYDAFIGQTLAPLMDPEDVDQVTADLASGHIVDMLALQPEFLYQFTVNDPTYGRRRKQVRYRYLYDTHDLIYIAGSDITDSVRLEQEQKDRLREALKEAEAANEAKSDFLSRMSHDIRTPLNGVIGMTGLALDEKDPAAVHGYLQKIDESGRFLLALVNDILDMSRIESGVMEIHPDRYDFLEFERYIASVIQPLCDAKGIVFTVKGPQTITAIQVDRLRINQIAFNLLSNAVKFTPSGGHVELDIVNQPVVDGKMAFSLAVSDDGIGMSAAFQRHLFEPFSQEHTAASDIRNGTGLGLAIVKQLVDLMGGTIEVRSELGEGSTFTVTLTMPVSPDSEQAPQHEVQTVTLEGRTILAAEDNAINAEIIQRLLEKHGASVIIAGDGEEAVNLFLTSEPYSFDAVLMDVRMPHVDGLEATRRIRALDRPDATDVPIIAMTANAFEDDVRDCLAAGMDSHIAKPVDPPLLFSTIQQLLAQRGRNA